MIFGLLHGFYVGLDMILRSKYPSLQNRRFFSTKIGKLTSILFTQYLIFFAFIAFRVENFDHMNYAMMKFIFIDFQTKTLESTTCFFVFLNKKIETTMFLI